MHHDTVITAHAVPGVQKLLIRVDNVEEKCEALNKRVESLENKSFVSPDTVKDLVSEEVAELKKNESRKLNLICLNLPESKRTDTGERQQEDLEFLNNLLENKMNLEPDIITVNKLLSRQPRVTVTSCFVYKVIRDLQSIYHLCINPIRRIGLIHK